MSVQRSIIWDTAYAVEPTYSGILAHYDASELNYSDGNTVTYIADLSGSGHNLSNNQGTTPTYRSGIGKNNMPAVQFGSGDLIRASFRSHDWSCLFDGSGFTGFAIVEFTNTNNPNCIWGTTISGSGDRGVYRYRYFNPFDAQSTGAEYLVDWGPGAGTTDIYRDTEFVNPDPVGHQQVHVVKFGTTDPDVKIIYAGGSQVAEAAAHYGGGIPDGPIGLGNRGANSFGGYFREALFYSRELDSDEISNVSLYLKSKWGTK